MIDLDELAARKVPIVAPEGFLVEAVSENVIAGPAMLRRAGYMYGNHLPRGPAGPGRLRARAVGPGRVGLARRRRPTRSAPPARS